MLEIRAKGIGLRTLSFLLILPLIVGCQSVPSETSSVSQAPVSPLLTDYADQFMGEPSIPDVIEIPDEQGTLDDVPYYSVTVDSVPINTFLHAIALDAEVDLVLGEDITGEITLSVSNRSLTDILELVSAQLGLRYTLNREQLHVVRDTPYAQTYRIDYLNMRRVADSHIDLSTQLDAVGPDHGEGQSGFASSNNSQSTIHNHSENHFWETLEQNLVEILGGQTEAADGFSDVVVNREAGVVVVRANSRQHKEIAPYIQTVVQSARKQVLIEAMVVEVSLGDEYAAGIDWRALSTPDEGYNYWQNLTGGPQLRPGALGELSAPGALLSFIKKSASGAEISATLSMLEQFGSVKILSSPKINALNNQAAVLKVVDNRVYFSIGVQRIKTQEDLEKLTTTTQIKTVPIGLVMNVIPYISRDDEIILNVRPTISRILGFVSDPNPDLAVAGVRNLVPEIQVREMESVLRVNNGGLVVIGGLMQERIRDDRVQVPWLSSIPVLGHLFSYKKEVSEKTELLVFLKPTVVNGTINYKQHRWPIS